MGVGEPLGPTRVGAGLRVLEREEGDCLALARLPAQSPRSLPGVVGAVVGVGGCSGGDGGSWGSWSGGREAQCNEGLACGRPYPQAGVA